MNEQEPRTRNHLVAQHMQISRHRISILAKPCVCCHCCVITFWDSCRIFNAWILHYSLFFQPSGSQGCKSEAPTHVPALSSCVQKQGPVYSLLESLPRKMNACNQDLDIDRYKSCARRKDPLKNYL